MFRMQSLHKTFFASVLTPCLVFAIIVLSSTMLHAEIYRVTDYGAVADGKTLNTEAIQKAVDECSEKGGGTVYFPAGSYLSGTIVFRDNVIIELSAGAVLLGSPNFEDYPKKTPEFRSYTDVNYTETSLIYAEKVKNIGIIGQGTIDGQGDAEAFHRKPYKLRPYTIRMIECENIRIEDITLRDSPMWMQHYLACTNLNVNGITVRSYTNRNNDGIDVDSCENVRITNCDISSLDDAIVIKSTSPRPSRRIVVTNCILRSDCNGFKLGTESVGGFEDITVSNIIVYDTRLSAIALEAVDGGTLDRVNVSNFTVLNTNSVIFLRLGNRARPYLQKMRSENPTTGEGYEKPDVAKFRNVIISNVIAKGANDFGCAIAGLPGHPVENVTLSNIKIEFKGGGTADLINREVPQQERRYPEYNMFGKLPAYGFYIRHARNIRFDNIQLSYENKEARPAIMTEDVNGFQLLGLQAQAPTEGDVVQLRNTKNAHKVEVLANEE